MVQIPVDVMKKIEEFLSTLKRHKIPIKRAILFGSYAQGYQRKWSDIDIALVSDIFEGDRISDKDKIRRITLSVSSEIDVIPFSPDDFNTENPFAKEIISTGISLV
jgi:uncharacterized protein